MLRIPSAGCLTGYQALLACKADYRALAERLQLHTRSFSTVQQYPWTKCLCCSALVVIGCLIALLSTCKNRTRLLQQTVAEQYQQLQDSQKQHEQEMEEVRSCCMLLPVHHAFIYYGKTMQQAHVHMMISNGCAEY